jgi:DnaJ-class molecular chaperone
LGVAAGCSEVELKASYRKLAMRWHPDRQVWWGSVALSLQK